MPILLSTKEALGQVRRLLAMNVRIKGTTGVGLFKGLERVESIAYKLKLPQELSRVHNTFHISNLKKCCSDDPLAIPLEGLHIDDKFHLVEEPVVIMDRDIKRLKSKPFEGVIQKMKDGYGDGDVTIHLTQIFSVNNWALKHNQFEGPPFIAHMMAICNAEKPMDFKAPRTSSHTEKKVSQGTKLGAKAGHKKQ
ncbi:hypothetical protein Tco_1383150 [Tanacetum coccineum]